MAAVSFAGHLRDGIGETRCVGCHAPLAEDRRSLGYCGQRCRRAARVVEKALELEAVARSSRTPEAWQAADAKWAAAAALVAEIREAVAGGR